MEKNYMQNNDIPSSQNFETGGDIQECNILNQNLGQFVECQSQYFGKDIVEQDYALKNSNVCYSQFNPEFFKTSDIINPTTTTFKDLENHMRTNQDLEPETIKSTMRILKKMEEHPIAPIDFKYPTPQGYTDYMKACVIHGDYNRSRIKLVKVSKIALNNRRKAWMRCLVAWGVDKLWPVPKIRKIPNRMKPIHVLQPEDIWMLTHYKYEKNRDLNRYIQYLFWFGAITGFAPEKEWIVLDLSQTRFDSSGRFHIDGVRPKVNYNTRSIVFDKIYSMSNNTMNFFDLLKLRNKFANKNEKALLVNPLTGKRFTEKQLYKLLRNYGTLVIPTFYPYILRHFCATSRMIEHGKDEYALTRVCKWLGHDNIKRTKKYLDLALMFDDENGNWISRAFKRPNIGRLHDCQNVQQTTKKLFAVQNSICKSKRICRDSNPSQRLRKPL